MTVFVLTVHSLVRIWWRKGESVEDQDARDDFTVLHCEALCCWGSRCDGSLWVVKQRHLLSVTEFSNIFDPDQIRGESANVFLVHLLAIELNSGCLAVDCVGYVAHGGLDVTRGPGIVVFHYDVAGV